MKFALSTLKEFLQTTASPSQISQKLTEIGLEVENIENQADSLSYFTVAEIIETTPHPNSNKLKICKVKTNDSEELLQIICGASNARAGIKVAYAPINSIIPSNQMQIKKAKIASVESCGMLCSARELCLGDEDSGIIEIPPFHQIGEKISDIFGKNDAFFEINVTPNRGDCLGVYGIARDLASSGIGTLNKLNIQEIASEFSFSFNIKNLQPQSCQAISYRQIRNLKNCQSPKWLQDKLQNVGINSISAIVDITNYIMHLYNRPLHAYDASKISREITIDFAKENQNFISLKKSSHQLNQQILTIADTNSVIAVAGIIGSENSSCDLNTTEILLESAFFNQENIAFSGRNLNILSDSRHRFERGIDPNSCSYALELASKLLQEICGGEFSEIFEFKQDLPSKIIDFDFNRFKQIIGFDIEQNIADKILENLGFKMIETNKILVPSHRHDIFNSVDLVEEILRIYGYNFISKENLPTIFSNSKTHIDQLHKIRLLLANSQFIETISWSFIDSKIQQYFAELLPNLLLKNPISGELNYLRTNLIVGLINSYKKNYLRNFSDLSLFEIGNIFLANNGQRLMISGLRAGKNKAQDHFQDRRDFDFFDVKNDFINICEHYGLKSESIIFVDENPLKYYHPHRFACAKIGKNIIGYIGEIHPQITKLFDIKTRINCFEIFFDSLPNSSKNLNPKAFMANDLPVVERDFCFVVNKDFPANNFIKEIKNLDKNLIKSVEIFDIFYGKNLENSQKSIAFRVYLQPLEKTLSSQEIDNVSSKIIDLCKQKFNATIRN